ncbi:flavodoxin domain-containing protein [Natribacillus halophilus]|uniref:Ribonucleotide reductase-associated flavodoxin, putative n=1 Tax=Natribacillus halophilus TaxID=549003 RepID=A0A1G8KZQ0_9BACI|nr:flavodoxin domain-containing protein [Natribacillus halophilus]SDI48360.1 ribonucleotide reductase-associated flavodoxin, putative [Natribacillus halophilus]
MRVVSKLTPVRRALILYESLSGNTAQLAAVIQDLLEEAGAATERIHLRSFLDLSYEEAEDILKPYRTIMIGSYTDDKHLPPEPLEELMDTHTLSDKQVAAFGTGDTQWGETYCLAAYTIARHYQSPFSVLDIEQMPSGSDQEKIEKWLEAISDD